MQLYQLYAKQALPISQEKAWEFLSDPKNLAVITPPHMGFHILSQEAGKMFPGQIIHYKVSPFPFYTTRWVTEITHVQEGSYFVDEQRFGPYSLWHHKHFLRPIPGGVQMEDVIDYKIPFGVLGKWVNRFIVREQLTAIFKFRENKLEEIFGGMDGVPNLLQLKTL